MESAEATTYALCYLPAMSAEDHKQALPPGFQLGTYRIVRILGVGGFGVTYLCEHTGLAVQVAVKEYLPNEIAVRDGTEVHRSRPATARATSGFLDEARTLARFEIRRGAGGLVLEHKAPDGSSISQIAAESLCAGDFGTSHLLLQRGQ